MKAKSNTEVMQLELHDPFEIPGEEELDRPFPKVHYAYEMRVAGAGYDLIAEKLGYVSAETARLAVMTHVRAKYPKDQVKETVDLELARLDKLQLICWAKAQQGDLKAVREILSIMTMRMKFLGTEKKPNEGISTQISQAAFFIGGTQEEYVQVLQQAREAAGITNGNTHRNMYDNTNGKVYDGNTQGNTE